MNQLFSKLKLRDLEFKNRIFMSPMCQYSATNGLPNDWHLVHLGSRAIGGASLVIAEATAVSPAGRISPGDLGLWNDDQLNQFKRITDFIKANGAHIGIQLAHAGRKASTAIPWSPLNKILKPETGAWPCFAPSALAFDEGYPTPTEMTTEQMTKTLYDFVSATDKSFKAGFNVVEIHMAHGYLLNEFLSPLSNNRTDEFGGSLQNRMRYPLAITAAVRASWPSHLPLFVRLSVTDWVQNGWTVQDSLILAKELKAIGVDFIDCSSGGSSNHAKIPTAPGYQVQFSEIIRSEVKIATGAVGLITSATQAEEIIKSEKADAVLIGRTLLRDPYWALHAGQELEHEIDWPVQYARAKL